MKKNLSTLISFAILALALSASGWGSGISSLNGLSGVVYSLNDGSTLGGVQLVLSNATGSYTQTAGPDGSFSFTQVADGVYQLEAYDGTVHSDPMLVPLEGGVNLTDQVWMYASLPAGMATISLSLQCAVSGNPLAGCEVVLAGPGGVMGGIAGASGTIVFTQVLPGTYTLAVQGSSFAAVDIPVTVQALPRQSQTIAVGTASTLASSGLLAGMLRNADASPVQGATVTIQGGAQTLTATTSAWGTYCVAGIPAGPVTLTYSLNSDDQVTSSLVSGSDASITSLRYSPQAVRPVDGGPAANPADQVGVHPLAYRSMDRHTLYFDAGAGTRGLRVRVFSLTGSPVADLSASMPGQVLALDVWNFGQGVYLAQIQYQDAYGQQVDRMQKVAVYR